MSKIKYIDLFSGAGGLSEGFNRAGFEGVAHVEMDQAACYTLKTRLAYNYYKDANNYKLYEAYLRGEISREDLYADLPEELLKSVINLAIGEKDNGRIFNTIDSQLQKTEVDVIIGGPPCQAYSLVGRARSANNMEGDPRNYLYIQYAKYLERYNPKMFVFENVIGLMSANKGLYLKMMEELFLEKGYKMELFVVEAYKFGVLQNRRRVVIIGWKDDFLPNIPNISKMDLRDSNEKVSDLLLDLPKIQAGGGINKYSKYINEPSSYLAKNELRSMSDILTQHISRPQTEQDKEIYKITVDKWNQEKERLNYNQLPEYLKTHKNRHSFYDRFKVVADIEPYSQTIVAHIAKDGHYYIHPDIEQNRSLTVREAARLQSFPDNYYFEGVKESANRSASFRQIGNAVPPLMAFEIAKQIKSMICL